MRIGPGDPVPVAVAGLVFASSQGSTLGRGQPTVLLGLAIGLAGIPLLWRRCLHHPEPLLDPAVLRLRTVWSANVANLFLSANAEDVSAALDAGIPAARVFPESVKASESHPDEIRIAFDGDAVLFSDESEPVSYTHLTLPTSDLV